MAKIKAKMIEGIPVAQILLRQLSLNGITASQETPYIEEITLQTDANFIRPYVCVLFKEGSSSWKQGQCGVDYDVIYPDGEIMEVHLRQDGDYKINY